MSDPNEHQTGVGLDHWGDQFPDTNWSILVTQHDQSGESARDRRFTDLCGRYWYPLYAYLRKKGYSSHDAQDLTQDFFAELLDGDRMRGLEREKGKFRSYLLGAMNHHLLDHHRAQNAQKRGGGKVPISIEEELAEHRFQNEPSDDLSAEKLFDRKWALTVMDDARGRLGEEFRQQGKEAIFEEVSEYLTSQPEQGTYREIASRLDLKEDNVRAIVSRMRKRYRDVLRDEVRATVSSDEEIEDELKHLFEAFV